LTDSVCYSNDGGVITLVMRYFEGIPYFLGIVQVADFVIFIPA
jgi:hypothetical protein